MDLAFTCLVVTGEVASMARDGERLLDGRERTTHRPGRDEDRARFIAGAALLRRVVSTLTGLPPRTFRWTGPAPLHHVARPTRRPGIGPTCRSATRVTSSSRVTRSAPVGVDIENRATEVTDAMRTLFAATAPHIRSAGVPHDVGGSKPS